MKSVFILFLAIVLFSGCGGNDSHRELYTLPQFPSTEIVEFEIVTDSLILPSLVYDIMYHDGKLLLLYAYENKWLHIYNIDEGKVERSLISRGRGPQDMLYANAFTLDGERNTLNLYDLQQRKLLSVDFDSVFDTSSPPMEVKSFGRGYMKVIPFGGKYLTYDTHSFKSKEPKTRFAILDQAGDEVARYTDYPIADSVLAYIVSNVYKVEISPDQSKMAAASHSGGILECFDLSDDKFREICTLYISEPHLKEGKAELDNDRTLYCFGDLWTTSERIYAAYGAVDNKSKTSRIAVFDWEGNPVKLYETGNSIDRFCIDMEGQVVYAVIESANDRSTVIGKFNL